MLVQVFILVLLGGTVSAAPVKVQLPYYKLMTPEWLYKYSTVTKPFTVYPKYLEIPAGKVSHERLIQAELIAPDILTITDSVVVKLTIAMDTVLADSSDHDPIFGISDGTSFIGFQALDKGNYPSNIPCYKIEGDVTNTNLNNVVSDRTGTKVISRAYSSEITTQIKLNDRWGSCHTEHDEGHVNIVNYQRKLDISKGLYLQMYRADINEKYYIEYTVVEIHFD